MSQYPINNSGGWIIPPGTELPSETKIPLYSTLGDGCRLGDWCALENGHVKNWLTVSNVDGSGRQVLLILRPDGDLVIRAGCFLGDLNEFVRRATNEGKLAYAAVIPAIAEALKEQL